MNSQIEKLLSQVTKLSSFEVNSVLGAVNYAIWNRALNEAIRLLPDAPPEGSGLEGVGNYEQAMKLPDIKKTAAPLIGLADRLAEVLHEYGTQPIQTPEGVLNFRLERPVSKSSLEAEFNTRKRRGEEPAGGIRRFVDDNYAQAMRARETLKAKGEIAVRVLGSIDGSDEDVGEAFIDVLMAKAESKLTQRWYAQDDRTTSSALDQNQKDEAEADKRLIVSAMLELGMDPPHEPQRGIPEVPVEQATYVHPRGVGKSADLATFFLQSEGMDKKE